MSSAPDVRQVRAALFLSVGLGLIGFWGANWASGELALQSNRPVVPATTGNAQEDASAAFVYAALDVYLDAPYGAALASLNLVASAMLVIGSFMVSARSKNAVWWVRNAIAANALHVALDAISKSGALISHFRQLEPLMRASMEASARAAVQAGSLELTQAAWQAQIVVLAIFGATIRLGLLALLFWRVGSAPVRGFLATASAEPE